MWVGSLWTHAAHPDHFIVANAGDWESDYWKGQGSQPATSNRTLSHLVGASHQS